MDTLEALKHLLWPTRCAACEVLLSQPGCLLCAACRKCVEPEQNVEPPEGIDKILALFRYENTVSALIAKWKYHEDFSAQKAVMSLIPDAQARLRLFIGDAPCCLVPVPPHPRRLRDRGYDPVWTFATGLRRFLSKIGVDAVCMDELLIRTRHTARQAALSHEERIHNLDGAFKVVQPLPSRRIILIDDVLTTGATAAACAKTLKTSGAPWVGMIALAKTVKT